MTVAKRIGLYPGTFDPVTLGHVDIIERAVKLVDHLVIGIADNPSKQPMFSMDERVAMLRHETAPLAGNGHATISVETFDTLLIHYAKKIGANVIVRGLRAVSDFEYEFQMVGMNHRRGGNPARRRAGYFRGPDYDRRRTGGRHPRRHCLQPDWRLDS